MSQDSRSPDDAPAARTVELPELAPRAGGTRALFAGNLDLIKSVKVRLDVTLGSTEITVADLFALKEGSVVALQQASDAPLDIVLDGRLVGRGELVVVGDDFGVRITEIGAAP